MALCAAEAIPFEDLFDLARPLREGYVEGVTSGITTAAYSSGNASILTWVAWAETLVGFAGDAGVSTSLPHALRECLRRTVELGQGDKESLPSTGRSGRHRLRRS